MGVLSGEGDRRPLPTAAAAWGSPGTRCHAHSAVSAPLSLSGQMGALGDGFGAPRPGLDPGRAL